jgi:hypothetical protein
MVFSGAELSNVMERKIRMPFLCATTPLFMGRIDTIRPPAEVHWLDEDERGIEV